MTSSPLVDRVVETVLPTRHGSFRMLGYRDTVGNEHVALVRGGSPGDLKAEEPALVRLHSECLTGDALGSRRCDCGEQLDLALAMVAAAGRGAVIYLRGHEGRGIGLVEKLRAYALQDRGVDTVDANTSLGHPADARDYAAAAGILIDLGLHSIVLLSSNPAKQEAVEAFGIHVADRRSLIVNERAENAAYLATKRARMQHDLPEVRSIWKGLLAGQVPAQAASSSDRVLLDRYGSFAAAGSPVVVAQLAQSMDGFIASRTGRARFVSGHQDREHLHRLRALVDAVVVGASTVSNDDPQLTVRAVPGSHPARVVLDPTARIPPNSRVLCDGRAETLWVVGLDAALPADTQVLEHRGGTDRDAVQGGVDVVRMRTTDGRGFAPTHVLEMLAQRGLRRVLVEGGGRTVSGFLDAGVLDRLYLTTAPLLIGDGTPGLRFEGQDSLDKAIRPTVRRYCLGEDICAEIDLGGSANTSI
ncbi:MAG: GTP cyclohydrolase II [Ornithinimicrobium sp.]